MVMLLCICTQAEIWIAEKLQIANDESFKDPTNLEDKCQKHHEFEAEINANEQRIQAIAQVIKSVANLRILG